MAPLTRRRVRHLGRRLAFSAVPLLALLGIAEVLSRHSPPPLIAPGPMAVLLSPHPTRIWGLSPGTFQEAGVEVTIHLDGLRAVPLTGAPHRVLTLGDSSIYGYGLPDALTLHASLGRALADRGVNADVLCGAVPGYSTEQSLQLLEDQGWALEPDLLLIGNLWSDSTVDHFQDRVWVDALDSGPDFVERGLAKSAAWRWLRRALTPAGAWYLPVGWIRDPTLVGQRRVPLEDYRENLGKLVQDARSRGVQAVMLQPANRIRLRDLDEESPHAHSWEPWFEAQRTVAAELDVPMVDARQVLKAADLSEDTAFLDDMHPTGAANAAYAAHLASTITAQGWLGSGSKNAPGDRPEPDSTGETAP